MLFYTGLIFLVVAVSLDGFGVGVTYGMRKIHVPHSALFIIMLCSGMIVWLSMTIGNMLSTLISPHIAKIIGGCILIFLGIFSLFNIFRESNQDKDVSQKGNVLKKVLTNPKLADLDRSGTISTHEAFLLGLALALDAFGAGLGASIIGYSPILTPLLISCMSGLFLFSGIKTGLFLAKSKHLQQMTLIPPILLMILGVYNIL